VPLDGEPDGSLRTHSVDLNIDTTKWETRMKIGLLGSGMMANALAPRWARAGHELFIGGRDTARARALGDRIDAKAGSLREAAEFGDICVMAVRGEGLVETIEAAGGPQGVLAGNVIIDCTNAVYLGDFSQVRWDGRSLAEQLEFLALGSKVVKAFNLCHADVWQMDPLNFDGRQLAVPYCGADGAKQLVRPLIESLGALPVDVGDLTQARHLEAMAIPIIHLLTSGAGSRTVFNLIADDSNARTQQR
jgi:predicted dinucleotide-binding enzyme